MKRIRLFPKSLTGQLALLVAGALFVAQAINFAFMLRERQNFVYDRAVFSAIQRITDTSDRLNNVKPEQRAQRSRGGDWDRDGGRPLQLYSANPMPAGVVRRPALEADIRRGLTENNVRVGQIIAGVRDVGPNTAFPPDVPADRVKRLRGIGGELLVGVELPGKGWVRSSTGWSRRIGFLLSPLLAQTLLLYVVMLVPLLLVGRRITRPLRHLAVSARAFRPGDDTTPLEEAGPSDVRAVIAAYNALRLRVTGMLEEKDRMLGAIGHDLRTPLAALRVRIESVEDDEDRTRMAGTIDEMNRTLDDILSLARLGRPSEPATDVDLAALVDAVVEDFRDLDHNVTFEESPRLRMRLRPALMRRAVRNLIENAVKYGGGAEVSLVPGSDSVAIEVADRGPGIPEDKLNAVFDPFTRLEHSRNRETGGIGLGLALARAIVDDAGGAIVLSNRAGGGLCARITLPRS